MSITQKRLKELFNYKDGLLIRKISTSNRVKIGDTAGYVRHSGYREVSVDGKSYLNHRLIYLYHNGYMPEKNIDYINKKPGDDRIENLREVSQVCNLRNSNTSYRSKTGIKGVMYSKRDGIYLSQVVINGVTKHIGSSKSLLEAACLRLVAEQCLSWGSCDSSSPAYQYVKKYININ